MRAALFKPSTASRVAARSMGRAVERFRYGGLELTDVRLPPTPGAAWVEVEVVLAGVCECDVAAVSFSHSPSLEPFASFPAVPGHEVVARVVSTGGGVRRVEKGQRVVVDPLLSCEARGFGGAAGCPPCSTGRPGLCERAGEDGRVEVADEPLAPGRSVGFHRTLPGGWAERMVVHESQCHPVPGGVDDQAAVLIEPLASALHSVVSVPLPDPDEPVLVLGRGPLALGVMWGLRALGFEGEVVARASLRHDKAMARMFGASSVVEPGLEARQALVRTGARAYAALEGPEEVYRGGGFSRVFVTPGVGGDGGVGQAVRYAAAGGTVVLVECGGGMGSLAAGVATDGSGSPGTAGVQIDPAVLAAREIRLRGAGGYGTEILSDDEVFHTFELALHLLQSTGAALQDLVTHVFPLEQVHDALSAAANPKRSEAIRVVVEPGAADD